ncbi:MAG: hypothetical protein ABUK01_00885 [Leptospirales bacterium]
MRMVTLASLFHGQWILPEKPGRRISFSGLRKIGLFSVNMKFGTNE